MSATKDTLVVEEQTAIVAAVESGREYAFLFATVESIVAGKVAEAKAEILREVAEGLNLHRFVPPERNDLDGLCEDDACVWWDMTYALRDELNDRANEYDPKNGASDD